MAAEVEEVPEVASVVSMAAATKWEALVEILVSKALRESAVKLVPEMAQLLTAAAQVAVVETSLEVALAAGDNFQELAVQTWYQVAAPITQEQLRLILLAPVGVAVVGELQEVTAGLAAALFREQVVLAVRQLD